MEFAATITADQADAARKVVASARAHIRALVPPGTIMALPTSPSIAPEVDLSGDELESFRSPRDATDVYGWPGRASADELACGYGVGLPGGAIADRLGRR